MSMGLATEWKEVPFKTTSASSTTSMPTVQLLGAEAVLMVLDSQLLTMLLKTFYGNKNILREK